MFLLPTANRKLQIANCKKDISRFALVILGLIIFMPSLAHSGSLDDLAPPGSATSAMFTIEDIFNRLGSGTAGVKRAGAFLEPSDGPGTATGHTMDDVMAKAPAVDATNGAVSGTVLTGKTFWGLTGGAWGLGTGTAGFGTSTSVPKTGQTASFSATGGENGDLQRGVAWPNPRFTIDGAGIGTVVDNLTGLIWLQDANCAATVGGVPKTTTLTWADALTWSNAMASGSCGLIDGSVAGDWRLPNRFELESLLHLGVFFPPIPNTAGTGKWSGNGDPFNNVQSSIYWSSTTFVSWTAGAWVVFFGIDNLSADGKTSTNLVWPVRGGQ